MCVCVCVCVYVCVCVCVCVYVCVCVCVPVRVDKIDKKAQRLKEEQKEAERVVRLLCTIVSQSTVYMLSPMHSGGYYSIIVDHKLS